MRAGNRSEFDRTIACDIIVGRRIEVDKDGTQTVVPDVIPARLKAMGVNAGDAIQQRMPPPKPPKTALRDSRGNVVRENGKPVMIEDLEDKDYVTAKREYELTVLFAMFVDALDDPDWHFDAQRPDEAASPEEWRKYYAAITAEFRAVNFPLIGVKSIGDAVKLATGIGDKEIAEAVRGF